MQQRPGAIVLSNQQKDRVWQVALAALLHDVGKLAQRAEADPERYRTLSNLHEFARTDEEGRTQYHHAAYTWQFIEEHLSWLVGEGEGGAENIAGWAARHHRPSSVWDRVVAESDQLSAGMDRGHPDEALRGWAHVQAARLTPLLARIHGNRMAAGWEIPFQPLQLSATIFPQAARTRSASSPMDEYRRLFDELGKGAASILAGDLPRFLQSFLTVYERCAWCVPAATNSSPCDVSLFEHSRAASAIAAVLTAELFATKQPLSDAIVRDRTARRYVLAVGDLSGIQRFLYTIVTKNAARALRGRSFVLQLLGDGIATYLLDQFGLPPVSALYNGGGKLWLLLPAFAEEPLHELSEQIDMALQRDHGGRLGFAVGTARLSGEDFVQKAIAERWGEATADLHQRRRRRFARLLGASYRDVFAPFGDPGEGTLCHVCGKLDADLSNLAEEARRACRDCRELEQLGNLLTRAQCVVRIAGQGWRERAERCRSRLPAGSENWYYPLPGLLDGGYLVSTMEPAAVLAAAAREDTVLALNNLQIDVRGEAALGYLLAGLNRARSEEGRTMTFGDLAERSCGIRRLGVLRLDVDGLGDIFANGLAPEERTISRLTNLSKTLAYFFGGFVSTLVEQSSQVWSGQVQVIYSGGDDVFLVGAWSALPAVARAIRREFGRFTADNPAWGISGGLAIVRPDQPIAPAAQLAGELEQLAKIYTGPTGRRKDALAFLGDALAWQDLDVTAAVVAELLALLDTGVGTVPGFGAAEPATSRLPRGWIHRLAHIAAVYRDASEKLAARNGSLSTGELEQAARRGPWVWTKAYALARATNNSELTERLGGLMDNLPGKLWPAESVAMQAQRDLIWLLQPAVVWADLLSRERR